MRCYTNIIKRCWMSVLFLPSYRRRSVSSGFNPIPAQQTPLILFAARVVNGWIPTCVGMTKGIATFPLLLSLLFWLCIHPAWADIEVKKAEGRVAEAGYQLAVDFNINLGFPIEQALMRGVTLHFLTEFTLTRTRWYWRDEVLMDNEHITKLSYNALTRQYRIARGSLFQNFANLDDALRIVARQASTPIARNFLKPETGYVSRVKESNLIASTRMRLDISQLPKPLQVNALTSEDWNLDSGAYRWILPPNTDAPN
jgi:Domain of unknown function (DUF4390)